MRIIDANTVEVLATYDEPTRDADETPNDPTDNPPLKDLAYTSIYYRIGQGQPVAAAKTPATSPNGGGTISLPLIVPAPVNKITRIEFWATATDLAGNTSDETRITFTVDRMAPLPPSNFSIA
jgi:hypothetical protein